MEHVRRNAQRACESIHATLEMEVRGRAEAIRVKKKLESDVKSLEEQLGYANRQCLDSQKMLKSIQYQNRELQVDIKSNQKTNDDLSEQISQIERKCLLYDSETQELRCSVEQAERARSMIECELLEANERSDLLHTQSTSLVNSKRKIEQDYQNLQAEFEEATQEQNTAEERAKKAIHDAAMMAEELKKEQTQSAQNDRIRKNLEVSIKDMQHRLQESEHAIVTGGKKQIQRMDQNIRELETELDAEQRRHADTYKNQKKLERKLKEIVYASEEDRKNLVRLQDLVDKLQSKVKTYKRQAEVAQEAANTNNSKFRKLQHEMEEFEERAELAESALHKARSPKNMFQPDEDDF